MPLPSTKLSFFLVGKEVGRTKKNCDVPKRLQGNLVIKGEDVLLQFRCYEYFAFKGTEVEESEESRNLLNVSQTEDNFIESRKHTLEFNIVLLTP